MFPQLPTEAYCIYNTVTGLWSRGGTGPSWGKKPKLWSSIGNLKNHLNQMVYTHYPEKEIVIRTVYDGCIIYDVAKQNKWDGMTIDEIYQSYINRTYLSKPYWPDYKVVRK